MISTLLPLLPISVHAGDQVKDVITTLTASDFHQLPVVENDELLGMLNRHDLIDAWLKDSSIGELPVREFTTCDFIYLNSDNSIDELHQILSTQLFLEIPVKSKSGKYLGFITQSVLEARMTDQFQVDKTPISALAGCN